MHYSIYYRVQYSLQYSVQYNVNQYSVNHNTVLNGQDMSLCNVIVQKSNFSNKMVMKMNDLTMFGKKVRPFNYIYSHNVGPSEHHMISIIDIIIFLLNLGPQDQIVDLSFHLIMHLPNYLFTFVFINEFLMPMSRHKGVLC